MVAKNTAAKSTAERVSSKRFIVTSLSFAISTRTSLEGTVCRLDRMVNSHFFAVRSRAFAWATKVLLVASVFFCLLVDAPITNGQNEDRSTTGEAGIEWSEFA